MIRLILNKLKREWSYLQFGLVMVMLVIGVMYLIPADSVQEIHNANTPANFALVDPCPRITDWPWWRGSNGRNVTAFDPLRGHRVSDQVDGWANELKVQGNSTPIAWQDQIFLFGFEADTAQLSLRSYSRSNGYEHWRVVLHHEGFQSPIDSKFYAMATPACDGNAIYTVAAVHGELQVSSVDMKGNLLWQKSPGSYLSKQSYGASPVVFQSLLIVSAAQKRHGYLAALHRQTGEIIWRVKCNDGENSSTPVVATISGRPQLVVGGENTVSSYDPATGKRIWTFQSVGGTIASSIAFDDEHVYATCLQPEAEVVCIKAGGEGDVTKSHLKWRQAKIGSHAPSPLCHEGLIYVQSDDGMLHCMDATTGKVEWTKRLKGNVSVSPVIAGDTLICCNELGTIYRVQTGISAESVSESSVGAVIIASPIILDDGVYLRTPSRLICIKRQAGEPIAEDLKSERRRY